MIQNKSNIIINKKNINKINKDNCDINKININKININKININKININRININRIKIIIKIKILINKRYINQINMMSLQKIINHISIMTKNTINKKHIKKDINQLQNVFFLPHLLQLQVIIIEIKNNIIKIISIRNQSIIIKIKINPLIKSKSQLLQTHLHDGDIPNMYKVLNIRLLNNPIPKG